MAGRTKGKAAVERKNKALEELEIEYIDLNAIKPNHYNPNRQSEHDFNLLLLSMREDGFTQPIVVVRMEPEHFEEDPNLASHGYEPGDIVIVDGEHRWRAAAQLASQGLNFQSIPVAFVPMNLAQAKIATLRHNRARGSEDFELSAQVLRDLQALGELEWAQDSLMLSDEEVNRLIEDVPAPEALAGDEFDPAWEPIKQGEDAETQLSDRQSSATPAAVEAQREAEKRIAEARTEEERQAVRRDLDVARFALTFAGDEAKIVKSVIGSSPAATVLDLCRAELDRRGQTADEALKALEEAEAVPS